MSRARVVEVIEVVSTEGHGTPDNPVCEITEWFLPDGTLIARDDPREDMNTT